MIRSRCCVLALALMVMAGAAHASTTAKAAKPTKAEPAKTEAAKPADTNTQGMPSAADQAAAMEAMMKLAQPGAMHDKLKSLEGHWKATVTSYMPPSKSDGEADFRMVLGGRYLVEDYKGTFNNAPFNGHGMFGYDNAHKQFFTTWVDDMSTGLMSTTGSIDDAGKAITTTGTIDGFDGKPMACRSVISFVDANNHTYQLYATVNGKDMLMMEIAYTRQGEAAKN